MSSLPLGPVVRGALRDFRRTWPQLMLIDLLTRAVGITLLAFSVTALLGVFVRWADDGVLADADIARFLLHPIGWAAFLLVGAVSVGIVFARVGILMVIGFGASEDRQVTWIDAVRYVVRRAGSLVRLAGEFVTRVVLLALPFLAVAVAVYFAFLHRHDINYYIAERPPVFDVARALGALLAAGYLVAFLRLFSSWILGVPLVLFENCTGGAAMRRSAELLRGRAWRVAGWLTVLGIGIAGASSLVTFLVGVTSRFLVPEFGGNLIVFALGLAATLLIAVAANLGLLGLAGALFALLLVRLHRAAGGSGRLEPAPSERGTLGERPHLVVPGRRFLVVATILVASTVALAWAASESVDAGAAPAVIAHRGASRSCPENTMAAFRRAIADGADWIELDVQENADDTVVVAHDGDFMRLAGSPLKVWEATDADLRDLDIGSNSGPEFADERVPTLAEVLRLARGRIGVVVELKYHGHDVDLERRVVEVVEKARMTEQIQWMSLELAGLQKAAALRPEWRRGLLNSMSVGDLSTLDLDFLALNGRAATLRTIRRAHRRGMQVYVWTVNDPLQMSVILSRGADGLITDVPAVAREVIAHRSQLGPAGRFLLWVAGESGFLRVNFAPSPTGDA